MTLTTTLLNFYAELSKCCMKRKKTQNVDEFAYLCLWISTTFAGSELRMPLKEITYDVILWRN